MEFGCNAEDTSGEKFYQEQAARAFKERDRALKSLKRMELKVVELKDSIEVERSWT